MSHVWEGYGTALFLEFGVLTPRPPRSDGSPSNPDGEMGLMLEGGWRLEGRRSILCGSATDAARWQRALGRLRGATVIGATLVGRLPEIDLELSTGWHVVSQTTTGGGPRWTLFDHRGAGCRWLTVEHGRLQVGESRES